MEMVGYDSATWSKEYVGNKGLFEVFFYMSLQTFYATKMLMRRDFFCPYVANGLTLRGV